MPKRILVILADGFEEIEAIAPIDIIRRGGVDVTVAGLGGLVIRGAHGIPVTADITLEAATVPCDGVLLPGGQPGTTNLGSATRVISLVKEYHARGALCAAICAAPTVLAKAGILSGKRATCYPGNESKLEGAIVCADTVVTDGAIITSRGAGTALPFSLTVLAYLTDRPTAQSVADKIIFPGAW